MILSFLGGIEWGLAIREEGGTETTRVIALGLSAVPSLAAWAALSGPLAHLAGRRGAGHLRRRVGRGPVTPRACPQFVDLRTAITALVAVILAIALMRL